MARPILATDISVTGCPEPTCKCGCVTVRLHDSNGAVISGVVLTKPVAELLARQVALLVSPDAKNSLATVRCEGVA